MSHGATAVAIAEREVLPLAAISVTPAGRLAAEILRAAERLTAIAGLADMQFARNNAEMSEEASAFAAYLGELCRPLDDMFQAIIRAAADNCGTFSPAEQKELAETRIVSAAVGDNWTSHFHVAAIGADVEPEFHTRRYVHALRENGT